MGWLFLMRADGSGRKPTDAVEESPRRIENVGNMLCETHERKLISMKEENGDVSVANVVLAGHIHKRAKIYSVLIAKTR